MGRSRGANRRKSSIPKVSRKNKNVPGVRTVPKTSRFQSSALDYDEKATQFANYERLGLLYDANQIGAVKDRVTGFKPRVKVHQGVATAPSSSSEPHVLETEMPEGLKTIRRVPPGEAKLLRKLIARHADDYSAMARDAMLNTHLHTAAQLRHRIGKLHEDDAEVVVAMAAAAAAGAPAPEPRGKRKLTRDPNPAFNGGSRKKGKINMNF